MILQNQIRCLKCKDEVYSAHRHDFVTCSCGAVAVDGGMEYLRRVGNADDWKEMSITITEGLCLKLTNMIDEATKENKNALGVLCTIARELKKNGYAITEIK